MKEQHTYTGLWITEDGFIRHELLQMGVTMKHEAQNLMLIRATTTFVKTGSTIRTIPVLQLMELLLIMTNFTTQEWCFSAANK